MNDAMPSIVVVRDRDPAAVKQPPSRVFEDGCVVRYVHAGVAGRLPESPRYVFNLDRLDDVSHGRAARACERGAQVTVVVRHVDTRAAVALQASGWSVLPAYGDTDHIGARTFRRGLRMAYDGHRIVAVGFLRNSTDAVTRGVPPASAFLRLVAQMSREAFAGERVVAAVLSPHRTGSKWLRDLIGWSAGSAVRVFHEHAIPEPNGHWPDWPCFADALALEADRDRQARMRRTALRRLLVSARRRYIFVTDRDPVDRLVSYFVKRHSQWLRMQLDESGKRFGSDHLIQHRFDAWLEAQVVHHARWFRTTLLEPFGLDVRCARPAGDGLLVASHGSNTLIVVPVERLTALRASVEAEFGAGSASALDDNSAAGRGDTDLLAAFRRQVPVPARVVRALHAIPEVACLRACRIHEPQNKRQANR
jgi:hypothetical protein